MNHASDNQNSLGSYVIFSSIFFKKACFILIFLLK